MSLLVRSAMVVLAVVLGAVACTSPDRPTVQADEVVLPTPLHSFDSVVAGTIGQLQAAAASVGSRLDPPVVAYRPAEPASLLQVPRVVMRADLADTDDGYVIIYEAGGREAARDRARELADYLGSGFGQTNFPADTQFSVSVLGDTVIFTTRANSRSDDAQRAEQVFDAVARVGEPVPVSK